MKTASAKRGTKTPPKKSKAVPKGVQKRKTKASSASKKPATKPAAANTPSKRPPRKRDLTSNSRECIICVESKPIGRNGANFPHFSGCTHESQICSACLLRVTVDSLRTRATIVLDERRMKDMLRWPVSSCLECGLVVAEEEICTALPRKDALQIAQVVAERLREADPRWMWCPAPNCTSGQLVPRGQQKKMVCVECSAPSCFFHRIPWHEGYTCKTYDESRPDAAQAIDSTEEYIRRTTKRCPTLGCGQRIEKGGGCSNMLCPSCHHTFVWDEVKWDEDVTPDLESS
ncbi:hypothetical protein AJ80_06210 [Polytolypa hystricis UAMH7299]|uniref:RBR-type E3 ubiquitin transferase n=1 Tax=Polytolypa hystricis (strain UAMH7299) TaxID=1447883 RepID=A0A2B7XXN6_POLH7|nr:hypothetical protein AJ80_06210 [Polytolypa hystricis UAMH7299]